MKNLREIMTDSSGNIRNKWSFNYEEMEEFLDVAQLHYTKLGDSVDKHCEVEGENLQSLFDKVMEMGLNPADVSLSVECDPDPYEGYDRHYAVIHYEVVVTEEDVRASVEREFNHWYGVYEQRLCDLLVNAGKFGYTLQEK